MLVELGADKEAKDADGCTPLHHAAANGHVEVIKLLAEMGAQVDARAADGETALQVSIRKGHHQAAQVLRELERTARAQKAAAAAVAAAETSERAQQAAEADRNAAGIDGGDGGREVRELSVLNRQISSDTEVVAIMCGWQGALTYGGVCGCSGGSALGAVVEATVEAEKHGDRREIEAVSAGGGG